MGNLIDTYILCPKYSVDEKGYRDNYVDRRDSEILELVTNDIDRAFLAEAFSQGCQLPDLFRVSEIPEPVWKLIEVYEAKHSAWRFTRRYRQDSVLQRLRKQFFTTLLVIANDYDPDKNNRFVIVRSDDLILIKPQPDFTAMTEEQFSGSTTEDQAFCQQAISELPDTDIVISDSSHDKKGRWTHRMADPRSRILKFLESENAFAVMGELKKQGLLTKEDITKAMGMSREEWLQFMKEKAGVADWICMVRLNHTNLKGGPMLKRIWSKITSAEKKGDEVPWKRIAKIAVEVVLVIVDILIDRKKW
jgi:hypothetical protein